MNFNCNSQALLDGLNIVTKALSSRPAKAILEGVLLETTQEGIKLTASDGNVTIQSMVDAQIAEEGTIVLPGRLFTEIIRKLPSGTVSIKMKENLSAFITCLNSKTTLAGMSSIDFPVTREMEHGFSFTMEQKDLKDMISKVIFSIATDESRQILTGGFLEITPTQARMIALDGFRMAIQKKSGQFDLPEEEQEKSAIIPGKVAQELSKIMEDSKEPVTITIEKNYLSATFGKTELLTILLAGKYINYKQIIPADYSTKIKIGKVAFADAIDRASLMAREGKNNLIHLKIEENMMTITSNAEMGDVFEQVEIDLEGKEVGIAFNARYLTDVVRNIEEEEFTMSFNSNVSPCVVQPVTGEDYLYLILPVRTFNS
ncbi:MAG: DNA polymerase III subunit beta [Clostridiales bacterium]|nr:DNA polymerase III subunit beta [Clostridiales bacterium]